MKPSILFCSDPFNIKQVDTDFADELAAARTNGFPILLFDYDALIQNDPGFARSIESIPENMTVIYRGWMLTPTQYGILYDVLSAKNYRLLNTPNEYLNCHYLPESLRFISGKTPQTVFEPFKDGKSIDHLLEKTSVFGDRPIIVKDYVKSEKHNWETACFVPKASDTEKLKETISNLISLRGESLNEGVVVREFVSLNELTVHSKSNMPLTEEYRLFFCEGRLLGIWDYWEEGDYRFAKPETTDFETIAREVESHFFTMDIARCENGEWIIIELGDAQVSGLPDKADRLDFYRLLANHFATR